MAKTANIAIRVPVVSADRLTERELFLMVVFSAIIFIATTSVFGSWRDLVMRYGDNAAYVEVATAIQHWNFRGLDIQHFMGYPYFIAAVSSLLRLPPWLAVWLIACSASLVSVLLTARLFGTLTASYFALSNFAWLQLSFLGGSEPLAVALGLGALWMFRRDRVFLAALLGGIAVTVRPLMIFVLIGIGVVLLYRRQFRAFLVALGTGLAVGGLYVLPLALYFGDPLLTVHSYTSRDYGAANVAGPHGHLFGWPFHGIVVGTILYPAPWTNLVLTFSWILLVTASIVMMFARHFRQYVKTYPNEGIYCGTYLAALFCYDYLVWARGSFIRFVIPVLPFVFYALVEWLPKDRRFVWLVGALSSILAGFSAIGIRNIRFR